MMKTSFIALIVLVFMLSACSENDAPKQASDGTILEQALANCVDEVLQEFEEDNPGQKLPSSVLAELGSAACDIMKSICNKDPEGGTCQSLIDKYMQ